MIREPTSVSPRDPGAGAADMDKALADVPRPEGVTFTVRGPAATMRSGVATLGIGLLMAMWPWRI